VLTAIAASGAASALALLALAVDETDEPFANVYSAAVSLQNLVPRMRQDVLIVAVGAAATGLALTVEIGKYQSFLFLLGSFFVPLFGVLAADFVLGGARSVLGGARPAGVRWSGIGAWVAGFAVYQWMLPTGPDWWLDALDGTNAGSVAFGASLPAFGASVAVYALARAWPRGVRSRTTTKRADRPWITRMIRQPLSLTSRSRSAGDSIR
jgi:purine-cytosine permease-like protein